MNSRSTVSLGPGASSLILIFVVLALSVLGMLSLLTARNDLKFSERSAQVIEAVYRLNEQAEDEQAEESRAQISRILAENAEALPEPYELFEDEIAWSEEIQISLDTDTADDNARTMTLDCAVRILPDPENTRTEWIRHNLSVSTEDEEWF